MTLSSVLRLICLAAIWGGSFLFMRISANALGPAYLIEARVLFAAVSLLVVAWYMKKKLDFTAHTKHFFIIGLLNTALPFLLFAYAAQTLPASILSILNSTAAIWGAAIAIVWSRSLPTLRVIVGLISGVIGVYILVGLDNALLPANSGVAMIAGVMAACCYGIASNYAKNAPKISSFDNAHGSMWAACLIVLPLLPFMPIREMPDVQISISVILLGVVCTGLAYLLYFRLIEDLGPPSALSVTFLIPLFGILWGYLFLDEQVGWNTALGALFVIGGTMLVTGFSIKKMLASNRKVKHEY
ncbi:DMT family transporter [Vibrio breoganii]|uniref:DMT family transporter n=1 Tax=Vibrio breoganii TaxID=553239 RepID=UPI0021C3F3A3|nr:DMT family transporter [Vibrio breoganii]MDN3715375.1 DMT family transporter [Vibrio breoganii]